MKKFRNEGFFFLLEYGFPSIFWDFLLLIVNYVAKMKFLVLILCFLFGIVSVNLMGVPNHLCFLWPAQV